MTAERERMRQHNESARTRASRVAGASFTAVLALALTVSACSNSPDVVMPSGPYAEDFARILDASTSDFEREVLADGEITREEYIEAHNLWLECMEDQFPAGSAHSAGWLEREDGLIEYVLSMAPGVESGERVDEFERLYDFCSQGTINEIAGLYNDISINPTKASQAELLFACLEREGLLAEGYVLADLEDDMEARNSDQPQSPSSVLADPLSPDVAMCIAGG